MHKPLPVAIATIAIVAAVAGCGPAHPKAHAAASKAAASASALATNSAVVADKAQAKKDITDCVTQVGVVHLALHPIKYYPPFKACLKAKAVNKAAFDTCMNALVGSTGFGPGKLGAYETGIAVCLNTGASPSPSATP